VGAIAQHMAGPPADVKKLLPTLELGSHINAAVSC
jgi:hypothetical protein